MDETCPVCNLKLPSEITTSNIGENRHIECLRCGRFSFTRTAGRKLESLEAEESGWKAKLSHWIRKENEENRVPSIDRNLLVSIIDEMQLPDIDERSQNLVNWLGTNLSDFSDVISIDPLLLSAVVGCEDGRGVDYIASHLANEGLLTYDAEKELGRPDPYVLKLGLTVKGWGEHKKINRVESTADKQRHSIFLSYAREDSERASELYKELKEAGFEPWMDTKHIIPGENWKNTITRAIRTSTFFVACLSNNSVKKRGIIQEELREALAVWNQKLYDDIYLIPVRLEDCNVPEPLAKFQWVDLFASNGPQQLRKALKVGLERLQQ